MSELIYKKESYGIIGCAMEVHRELGTGFLEKVYEKAMKVEFALRGIPCDLQVAYPVFYKGNHIQNFICDLTVRNTIIVEFKAVKQISDLDRAQILNYLKVTDFKLGMIINFGSVSLEYERFVN